MNRRSTSTVVATCAAAAVLLPGTAGRAARLLAPSPATSVESAVLDLAAVLGTAVLCYLAVVSTVVVVLGRIAPRSRALVLALRLTPARWRRIVLAAAGAAVVLAAQAPSAGEPGDVRPPPVTGLRLPDRPDSPAAGRPVTAPGPVPIARTRPVVVVRAGDSLWRIARRALPASASTDDVARSVRRWYRANRSAIGADPDLVHPGTRLVHPRQEIRP